MEFLYDGLPVSMQSLSVADINDIDSDNAT